MKTGIAALALVAALALGACSKHGDGSNASTTDATANADTTIGDTNAALENGVEPAGNALDAGGNAIDATGGNASNSL